MRGSAGGQVLGPHGGSLHTQVRHHHFSIILGREGSVKSGGSSQVLRSKRDLKVAIDLMESENNWAKIM